MQIKFPHFVLGKLFNLYLLSKHLYNQNKFRLNSLIEDETSIQQDTNYNKIIKVFVADANHTKGCNF